MLVQISRPMNSRGSRRVMVDGAHVGYILAGAHSDRHDRNRGWEVVQSVAGGKFRDAGYHRMSNFRQLYLAEIYAREVCWWPAQFWRYTSREYTRYGTPEATGCVHSRRAAIDTLVELLELGASRKARMLRRYGAVNQGGDLERYAEVTRCACALCAGANIRMVEDGWTCEACAMG